MAASEFKSSLTSEEIQQMLDSEKEYRKQREIRMKQLEILAESGDGQAAYDLGKYYVIDSYSDLTHKKRFKWWSYAAELGHLKAMQFLAGYVSDVEAFKWYKKAAEQEQSWAQFGMGYSYLIGRGIPQHYAKALKWLRLSAAQNHSESKRQIGIIYEKGYSVKIDYVLAHVWYNLAAAQQNYSAIKNRDAVAKLMSSEQITEAQDKAAEWPESD